jgi:hypothetical protein
VTINSAWKAIRSGKERGKTAEAAIVRPYCSFHRSLVKRMGGDSTGAHKYLLSGKCEAKLLIHAMVTEVL